MGSTRSEGGGPPTGYIRGAAGSDTEPRSIAAVVVGFAIAVLSLLAVVLIVQAVHENSRHAALRDDGVPVSAVVARCVGQATGTGITTAGYTCYGSFSLDGRRRTDLIRGSSRLFQPGAAVAAVVDRHDVGLLATRASVTADAPPWRSYVAAAIVIAVLAVVAAGASTWRSRRRQMWRRSLVGASN